MITAAFTPAIQQSSRSEGVELGGAAIIAKSTSFFNEPKLGTVGNPSTAVAEG